MRQVLIVAWGALLTLALIGFLQPASWIISLFIISPILAIGSAVVVARRDALEPQTPAWSMIYRGVIVALVGASLVGLVTSAAGMTTDDHGGRYFENAPLAGLFLLGLVLGWRALTGPSPRRAAIPALVLHLVWIPLVMINMSRALSHPSAERLGARSWEHFPRWCLLVVLGTSALASLLALASFAGTASTTIAKATARS